MATDNPAAIPVFKSASYMEAERIVNAVLEGAERPASVDDALWESTCQLYARLMTMSKEERLALLEEMSATRH